MKHINNTFSYSQSCGRNWIERKLCPTFYIVIIKIDNENAELYFRNSTPSYCDLPMNVLGRDNVVTDLIQKKKI